MTTQPAPGTTVTYSNRYNLKGFSVPVTVVSQYTAGNAAGTWDQVVIRNAAGKTLAVRLAELTA